MTLPRLALSVVLLALLLVAPSGAGAQTLDPDPWESARWRFGPFAVTPKVELKNLGWDTNVFNDPEDPKSSFTTTVGAPIDWWLRLGRARLHGLDYFEGVYFATYGSQSSFNQRHDLTLPPRHPGARLHRRAFRSPVAPCRAANLLPAGLPSEVRSAARGQARHPEPLRPLKA